VFDVKITDPAHPVTAGLPPSCAVSDELYHNIRMQPGVHVLATAFDDPSIGGTGKDEPVLWTVNYGKGRVFHTTLGHDVFAMSEPGFVDTFRRGTYWAARNAAFTAQETKTATARVMLVTGGHDHEPSFYSVFDGHGDLQVNVNPHPIAFKNDLRKSYDVLVLYDMIEDLDDQQKKNVRDFIESGKGIVVLHHALANFATSWPWWYEAVAGARYVTKADSAHPASTYLHDQLLTVKPRADPPVLRGIPPFHIEDETYKQMWFSPDIQVLLTTDHPTSDGPVAWISPFAKSRVVCIQLGHGAAAHRNPAYRNLVHNAILWSAGTLK
jgi:type 1 glutamine amidotransferase